MNGGIDILIKNDQKIRHTPTRDIRSTEQLFRPY